MTPFENSFPGLSATTGNPIGAITAYAGFIGGPKSLPATKDNYNTTEAPKGFGVPTIETYGWMVCDGRELYIKKFQPLFLTLGFLYSQPGDKYPPDTAFKDDFGIDDTFRIPDYRGYFLRMVSGNSPWPKNENDPADPNVNPDPDTADRFLLYDRSSKNTGLGSVQDDALQTHKHGYKLAKQAGTPQKEGTPVVTLPAANNELTSAPTSNLESPPGDVKLSDKETRAKNMYVYYLIKFA